MTAEQFLTSLNPEQTEAFLAIRDAIHESNGQQNFELASAKAQEVESANAQRDEALAARQMAEELTEKHKADAEAARNARDLAAQTLSAVRASIAENDDAIAAAIADSQKDAYQKRREILTAEIAAKQAELDRK